MKTLRISDEIYKIIEEKALANKLTKRQAAEAMILDFEKSSPKERRQQAWDRHQAVMDFINRLKWQGFNPDQRDIMKRSWQSGFGAGWKLFQFRKLNSAFRRKV